MTKIAKVLSILIVLVCIVTASTIASEKPLIEIKDEAYVSQGLIYLDTVAEITADQETEELLKQIQLATAPFQDGAARRITVGQIEVRLRQADFNTNDLKISGSEQVRVIRRIENVYSTENSEPNSLEDNKQSTSSEELYQVIVLSEAVRPGDILTEEKLIVDYRPLRGFFRENSSLEDYIGMRTIRYMSEGTVITPSAVEVPPVIERRSRVTLVVNSGNVQVAVSGISHGTGGVGDVIQVENTMTGERVYGTIVNGEIVEVKLGGTN